MCLKSGSFTKNFRFLFLRERIVVNEEKRLGKGNYGSVYEGRLLPDQPSGSGATSSGDSGLRVAVKKPHREDHVTWMNDLVPSVEDRCALLAEMKVLGELGFQTREVKGQKS